MNWTNFKSIGSEGSNFLLGMIEDEKKCQKISL